MRSIFWALGTSSTAEYSLAARLVAHLRGPARRIGLSLTDEQLSPDITETTLGDGKVQRNVSHADSIKLLMDKLAALTPQQQDRRGQYLRDFFREEKYKRKAGERIAEWLPRWEEGVDRLRRDGVDFAVIDDLPGWFMLEHANLSESRLEMLRSHVPKDKIHDLAELRQSFLRLFPHIHVGERRFVAQRGQAQGRRRQVLMANEDEETTPEEEEEGEHDSAGSAHAGGGQEEEAEDYDRLQEVFQTELEALAEDLEEAGELDDETAKQLEEAALAVSSAQEAMEVMRGVRSRVKGRGKGGRSTRGKPSGPASSSRQPHKQGPPTHPPRRGGPKGGNRPAGRTPAPLRQTGPQPTNEC